MPKIIGATLAEHRAQTRRRVFDAFATLLAERGYGAVTMADIASAAGLGRTALYNHFPDKDAVVVALATDETDRYLTGLAEVLAGVSGPVERLRAYLRHYRSSADEFHLGLGPELYGMLSRQSLTEIRSHVIAVEEALGQILAEGIASGDFHIDDPAPMIPLIHACLQPRHLSLEAVEGFVLRGVGAAG